MLETLFHWIIEYAYFGLFSLLVLGIVGLPIPDEILLTYTGYLNYKGYLHLFPTIVTAFLGSTCGITLSYLLGRTAGVFLIEKYGHKIHLTVDQLNKVRNWLDHSGKWLLVFGYFILGVRHLFAYAAGMSRLRFPVFALFTYAGAFFWTLTFISLGFFLGEGWRQVVEKLHGHLVMASCAVMGLAVAYLFVWRCWQARQSHKTKR